MTMQQVYFFGPGRWGRAAYEKWFRYPEAATHRLAAFVSSAGAGECCGLPVRGVAEIAPGSLVVLTLSSVSRELYLAMKAQGAARVYRFRNFHDTTGEGSFFETECRELHYDDDSILPQVELHAVDHCNLNCRGCNHFSPLFPPELPDLSARLADVRLLKGKFSRIEKLLVLGGEPLLHPELPGFLDALRALLPETELYVVTNGLLLKNAGEALLDCFVRNAVVVEITAYPPTARILPALLARLSEKRIHHVVFDMLEGDLFYRPLSLSDNSRYPQHCTAGACTIVWKGRIARCAPLMFLPQFNKTFGADLPEAGVLSLSDCPDGGELLRLLERDVPLCRHCVATPVPWSPCGREPKLEDFALPD